MAQWDDAFFVGGKTINTTVETKVSKAYGVEVAGTQTLTDPDRPPMKIGRRPTAELGVWVGGVIISPGSPRPC